jgi:sterol desaturase/sphingolipid hydroxylase (fatty acid hydroxylase superfamily)
MTELNIGRPPRAPVQRRPMTTGRFARLFFKDNVARFYLVTSMAMTAATVVYFGLTPGMLIASLVSLVVLAALEYMIHRWFLHNQLLYRHPFTAKIWRHLHYAHHMNPTETGGMIGPPQYAIPVMLLVTLPLGWLIGGVGGAAGAAAVGFWLVLGYEYAHGYAHIVTEPGSPYGRMLRHLHMLHHFHNEKGNFGVTSPLFDFVFGTHYSDPAKVARCPTAKNLGYTSEEARRYPWAGEGDLL